MKTIISLGLAWSLGSIVIACSSSVAPATDHVEAEEEVGTTQKVESSNTMDEENQHLNSDEAKTDLDTATFGAGCFWCVEAVFQELKGVKSVRSGYTGGFVKNPSYKEVCTGRTGHAEVAQITYDPSVISYDELLEVFWKTHDPTTLNRQGNDVGTQYRSSVFYHNESQKQKAEYYKQKLDESEAYPEPIVTTIEALGEFYVAEDYHQDYFNNNTAQPYCTFVIQPKVEKFRKAFADKLSNEVAE